MPGQVAAPRCLARASLLIAGNGFNPFRDQTIEPAEETAPWDGALDATLHVFHSQHRPAVEDNKFNIDRPDFLSISSASPRLSLTSPPRPSIVSMIASGNSKMPQAGKLGSPRKWNKPPQVGLLGRCCSTALFAPPLLILLFNTPFQVCHGRRSALCALRPPPFKRRRSLTIGIRSGRPGKRSAVQCVHATVFCS